LAALRPRAPSSSVIPTNSAVELAPENALGVYPLDLAESPPQEVEVVDEHVHDQASARPPIGIPIVPSGQEGNLATCPDDPDRSKRVLFNHPFQPYILGKEADDVSYEQLPFAASGRMSTTPTTSTFGILA